MAIGIRCFGKVQGVFFRATTKTTADDLGIKGWVRNEKDGSVSIHAEGSESQINQLIGWCQEGPQFAKVTSIETWEEPDEGLKDFEIKR